MNEGRARSDRQALEARTVAAHDAYLAALNVWTIVRRRYECSRCSHTAETRARLAEADETAQVEKERCRNTLRDLMDELGYLPPGASVRLLPESESCNCRRSFH